MTSSCAKCSRAFIPSPGTQGEALCFECEPRTVKAAATATEQRRNRRSSRSRKAGHSEQRADGLDKIQRGGVLFVIGAVVTFCTYTFANVTGGYYLLAWGPLVFGGFRFFAGIIQYFVG